MFSTFGSGSTSFRFDSSVSAMPIRNCAYFLRSILKYCIVRMIPELFFISSSGMNGLSMKFTWDPISIFTSAAFSRNFFSNTENETVSCPLINLMNWRNTLKIKNYYFANYFHVLPEQLTKKPNSLKHKKFFIFLNLKSLFWIVIIFDSMYLQLVWSVNDAWIFSIRKNMCCNYKLCYRNILLNFVSFGAVVWLKILWKCLRNSNRICNFKC